MTKEIVESMLPAMVHITQEMIDEARPNLDDPRKCLGAMVLNKTFGDVGGTWLWYTGFITGMNISITTREHVDMTKITEPQTVVLINRGL